MTQREGAVAVRIRRQLIHLAMQIVGLPDNALCKNRERVQAALYASGLTNVGMLFWAFNPEFPVLWRLAGLAPTAAFSAVSCDVSFQEMATPNYTAEIA